MSKSGNAGWCNTFENAFEMQKRATTCCHIKQGKQWRQNISIYNTKYKEYQIYIEY
jgi:hypothetical protein